MASAENSSTHETQRTSGAAQETPRRGADLTDANYSRSAALGEPADGPLIRGGALLEPLLARAPLQLAVLDGPEHRLAWANPAMFRRDDVAPTAWLGRRLADLLPDVHAAIAPFAKQVLATGEALVRPSVTLRDPGFGHRSVHLTLGPVRGPAEQVTGVLLTMLDRPPAEAGCGDAERSELLARERAALAQAELANRAKDEFIARISHELATPLAAMKMWIHLLRLGDPSQAPHALEAIDQCATAQAKLIEDLLDVSRAISGKLRVRLAAMDPVPVVEAAVNAMRPEAEAKQVAVELHSTAVGLVVGDADRVRQIVSNLLSNAVKFTHRGGRVRVAVERGEGEVRIRVQDDGQGIEPDVLPQIFEPFRQGEERSITREHGGLGLGLSIVKQLVRLHGGAVHAESAGPGRGAAFTVTLPGSERPVTAAPPLDALRPRASTIGGLDVLVVEDDEATREGLTLVLEAYGVRVRSAASADAAYAELQRRCPDVMLCDIAMPGEDGYSLIRRVRALGGAYAHVPAAAITAHGRVEDRIRALTSGFQQHVVKPVEPSELSAVIASLAAHPEGLGPRR